ncbi:lipopolysaccharide transport system permease protein [Methylobacterium sp. 174MFSha1.1]|uniref:ABC transporter permease n=1 Tax=Methylobacterium sp. 174MFSha1.1 TaxID=1502749 RepID=UPI0008EBA6EB|nr:ABC transporter permease [Methylobacterium sp. 174MFSha1.1]SFU47192.1 lipopolysaccharide transport system permease protein [Methylobacterium sp. 174MFSha1.1]
MTATAQERSLVIEPGRSDWNYWGDLWHYRELMLIMAWRDVSVRYKQTAIGVLWAVIRPLLTTIVLTVVFGRLAGLPSDGQAPYAVMVFTGMLPWFLMSGIVTEASGSLVANANLVGKVYFPRLIVPIATTLVNLVDFLVNLAMLALVLAWFGFVPSWRIVFLPLVTAAAVAAALGPGIILSALTVKYRDFRFVVPFVIQFGLYVTPVGFSSAVIPGAGDCWPISTRPSA